MDQVPSDFDGSFLVGATVIQVCVGAHQVILNMDPPSDGPGRTMFVSLECGIRSTIGGSSLDVEDAPAIGVHLVALLNEAVLAAEPTADGTLLLTFGAGTVELLADEGPYESFQIGDGLDYYVF